MELSLFIGYYVINWHHNVLYVAQGLKWVWHPWLSFVCFWHFSKSSLVFQFWCLTLLFSAKMYDVHLTGLFWFLCLTHGEEFDLSETYLWFWLRCLTFILSSGECRPLSAEHAGILPSVLPAVPQPPPATPERRARWRSQDLRQDQQRQQTGGLRLDREEEGKTRGEERRLFT